MFGKVLLRTMDPFRRKALRKTTKIVVVNSEVAKKLDRWKEKVEIIPAIAAPIQPKREMAFSKKFHVLSAGRFHYMKGFDVTIRAFAKFYHKQKDVENIRLILVGSGPEEKRLRKIAVSEGVA